MPEPRLRLAIQKSSRLSEGSFELLHKCGLTISRGRDKLYGRAEELPLDVLLVRDDDIPAFVADGVCDIGIVGENVFEEVRLAGAADGVDTVMKLGFSRCRLMLAAPKALDYAGPRAFAGQRIATSYPQLTSRFLERAGVEAYMVSMAGSVEVAPRLKIADAVCDIVATGGTLDANGLKPVETVFTSEAILVRAPELAPAKAAILEGLAARIRGVVASRDAKYVMMNAPRDAVSAITALVPGAEAPTVLDLAGHADRVAVHAVCREAVFWSTLEKLKAVGASAILVLPIEKMMH